MPVFCYFDSALSVTKFQKTFSINSHFLYKWVEYKILRPITITSQDIFNVDHALVRNNILQNHMVKLRQS
jgi:hypothetical protein